MGVVDEGATGSVFFCLGEEGAGTLRANFAVDAEAQAAAMQRRAKGEFGPCISLPVATHRVTSRSVV